MQRTASDRFILYCREGWIEKAEPLISQMDDTSLLTGLILGYAAGNIDVVEWILKEKPEIEKFIDYSVLIVNAHDAGADDETLHWALDKASVEAINTILDAPHCTDETRAMMLAELEGRAG